MGYYNFLSYYDRLYEYFDKRKRKFDPDRELPVPVPIPFVLYEVFSIVFMAFVLGVVVLIEMGFGYRGEATLFKFFISHMLFGMAIPVIVAFVINRDLIWGRQIVIPMILASTLFYMSQLLKPGVGAWFVCSIVFFGIINVIFIVYLLINNSVSEYYAWLKRSKTV